MIRVLSVPSGTPCVRTLIVGASVFDALNGNAGYTFGMSTTGIIRPVSQAGDDVLIDPGYLLQGNGLDGENDVEHLDFQGSVTRLPSIGTPTLIPPGGTRPTVFGVPFVPVRMKQGTTVNTNSTQAIFQIGDQVGWTRAFTSAFTSYKGSPKRYVACHYFHGWIDAHTMIYFYVMTDAAYPPYYAAGITGQLVRFNDDYSLVGSATLNMASSSVALPLTATWEDYLRRITPLALALSTGVATGTPIANLAKVVDGSLAIPANLTIVKFTKSEVFPRDLNPDWGSLASNVYSTFKTWDNNGGAYVRDFLALGVQARETFSLFKDLVISKNPVSFLKDLADLFLSFRYGWCLTMRDTVSLVKADYERVCSPKGLKSSSSSSYPVGDASVTARIAVYANPYSDIVSDLDRWLKLMDFDASLENLWDLVPFSFVVDWFIDLGSLLGRMDQLRDIDSYRIRLTGRSIKARRTLPASYLSGLRGALGAVTCSYYKRTYTRTSILPSLASYSSPSQSGFQHWLEAISLIVQRL